MHLCISIGCLSRTVKVEIKLKTLNVNKVEVLKSIINYFLENENAEAKMKKLEQKFASLQIVKIIEKLGNEKVF
jgi:hypothetical protein